LPLDFGAWTEKRAHTLAVGRRAVNPMIVRTVNPSPLFFRPRGASWEGHESLCLLAPIDGLRRRDHKPSSLGNHLSVLLQEQLL
jgi:hypothetical protein